MMHIEILQKSSNLSFELQFTKVKLLSQIICIESAYSKTFGLWHDCIGYPSLTIVCCMIGDTREHQRDLLENTNIGHS